MAGGAPNNSKIDLAVWIVMDPKRDDPPPIGANAAGAYRTVTRTTLGGAKAPVTLLHGNTARS
jgi:hypothetical protein